MARILTTKETLAHGRMVTAKLLGQDGMDDDTTEKLKAFLQSKLHPSDHAAACALMDGGNSDVDAQDDVVLPENDVNKEIPKATPGANALAGDASFYRAFPDAARIRQDTSGLQPAKRPAGASDLASFYAMYPEAQKVKLA